MPCAGDVAKPSRAKGKLNSALRVVHFMGNKEDTMVGEEAEVIAACALCPNEECGALVIAHRWAEGCNSEVWDFVCSRCGVEFSKREEELIFHLVPLEMLSACHHHAA
jgi:hypothetical protein